MPNAVKMPNAVIVDRMPKPSKQLKPSTLVKVEKENENTDIKRRMRSINKDRVLNTKQENVWERLSKVRKSTSNDSSLAPSAKNKQIGRTRSTQRLPPLRNTSNQIQKKPLSAPNPNTNLRRSAERKPQYQKEPYTRLKIKSYNEQPMPSPPPLVVTMPRAKPEVAQFAKPVKEILTVRSMNNSKSSSDESKEEKTSKKKSTFQYKCRRANSLDAPTQYEFKEWKKPRIILESSSFSNNSLEDIDFTSRYQASTEAVSFNSSVKIQNNLERLLEQKQKTMHPDEVRVIQNVVKSDERYRQLKNSDDRLFKDILKTQLREILKQGTVVKSALHHLDGKQSLAVMPLASCPESSGTSSDVQQVDVIFKNVPTLEKEIIILRALGEKLEATLKRTVGSPKASTRKSPSSAATRVKRTAFLMYDATRTGRIAHRIVGVQCLATVHVRSRGIMRTLGFVREFYIAHKTLVELKNEANRHFYLPMNGENMELKRTNFMKLKQNPNILMQHLKSKNQELPFNVLDQDPMFFHSLLSKEDNSSANLTAFTSSDDDVPTTVTLCEGGDSTKELQSSDKHEEDDLKLRAALQETDYGEKEHPNKTQKKKSSPRKNKNVDNTDDKENSPVPKGGLPLTPRKQKNKMQIEQQKRRRCIRRTPMPIDKYVTPKNNLFKTILVGSMQISCFLLLIMAFTYPDLKC